METGEDKHHSPGDDYNAVYNPIIIIYLHIYVYIYNALTRNCVKSDLVKARRRNTALEGSNIQPVITTSIEMSIETQGSQTPRLLSCNEFRRPLLMYNGKKRVAEGI